MGKHLGLLSGRLLTNALLTFRRFPGERGEGWKYSRFAVHAEPSEALSPVIQQSAGIGFFLAILLSGLAGCAPIARQPADASPEEPWSREKLLQALVDRRQHLQSLRSLATITYGAPEGRRSFDEAVIIQRPDRLRLETLSALGAILVVTANPEQMIAFHPREGLFFRGRSSRENLLRYTQIPLELEEIADLLMGLPPVRTENAWESRGISLVRGLDGGGKEVVSFDLKSGLPVKWERLAADETKELSAVFSDFSSRPGGLFPSRILLEAPKQKKRLDIRYREPELNIELAANLFVQEKPPSAREIPIEALEK